MEENIDNQNILNYNNYQYIIHDLDINKNNVSSYRNVLYNHKYLNIVFNDNNSSSIKLNTENSLKRIAQMAQIFAEEIIMFIIEEKDELSSKLSKYQSNKSLSMSKKNMNYENLYKTKTSNENPKRISEMEKIFYCSIKFLYILYLIFGISIIFIIIILRSIFDLYFFISFLLIILMLNLAYEGISKFFRIKENENNVISFDSLFWHNFVVLFLTMVSFLFLIEEKYSKIKEKKYIGLIIIFWYIFMLIFESISLFFYDLVKELFYLEINNEYILLESNEENERLLNV